MLQTYMEISYPFNNSIDDAMLGGGFDDYSDEEM
jgi:hypothetical protein